MGDWDVIVADGKVSAIGRKLDSLETNPPFPPYYNKTDNERVVRIGNLAFGNPRGDNFLPEIPITTLKVELVTPSGAFDGMQFDR